MKLNFPQFNGDELLGGYISQLNFLIITILYSKQNIHGQFNREEGNSLKMIEERKSWWLS
jgi:hypothetical protein